MIDRPDGGSPNSTADHHRKPRKHQARGGNQEQANEHPEIPSDPIYGQDAAARFVADNFGSPKSTKFAKPAESANQKPGGDSAAKPKLNEDSNEHKKLSIFVNLAANRGLLNSSLREEQELRKLEKLTKDKDVTLVVQVAMNRDRSLNHLRATQADRVISNLGGLDPDVKQIEVVRYEIANGNKKLLFAGHSEGLTQDLSNLLASDPAAMKADRVMLFNRAHGMAMHGLRGDAGNTPVSALSSTLNGALKAAGKERFDLIDLDSCLMANAQALSELSSTTKYLIASEEPEVAVAAVDMSEQGKPNTDDQTANAQPITEAVRKLILKPDEDLKTTAIDILHTNEEQCKIVSPDGLCGANTLGLYDETAAPEFSRALNQFGDALLTASKNVLNFKFLQDAIAQTPEIDGEPDGLQHTVRRRDLSSFVQKIDEGITSGALQDDDAHDILHAATQLETSMKALVVEHFNSYKPPLKKRFEDVHLPPAELGGISTFLQSEQPTEMREAFNKQSSEDSTSDQPRWNQFVTTMGQPK